jgi:hypothetical protein
MEGELGCGLTVSTRVFPAVTREANAQSMLINLVGRQGLTGTHTLLLGQTLGAF